MAHWHERGELLWLSASVLLCLEQFLHQTSEAKRIFNRGVALHCNFPTTVSLAMKVFH